MSSEQLRRRVKKQVDAVPSSRLRVAADFLAYLCERPANAASRELLEIPGFLDAYRQSLDDASAGRLVPLKKLARKR